jgi:hypothetical protein
VRLKGLVVSDQAFDKFGGANRDRTGDLYNAIVMVLSFLAFPGISASTDRLVVTINLFAQGCSC